MYDITLCENFNKNIHETCLPWQGRVYADDVWSGGTKEEAEDKKLPLLSTAIEGGLFHPNCKHSMFTYYYDRKKAMGKLQEDGVEVTPEEQEHRRNHLHIQQQKRLEEGSLDPQNIQEAKNKKEQWIKKDEELNFGGVWDELFKQQRENKKNTPAPVNEKVLPDVFKKANSIEEATKFGKLYSKYDDFKVADDVKLEIVNGFNEAAYNVKKKYGRDLEIKGVSKMLGTNPNQAAIGKTSKLVELKNNSLSVLKKKAIKNFESNWNATDDVYGVFYHEIGHAVWDDLSNNARFEITSIYRKLREETYKEWKMMGGSKSMYKHADVFGMQLSRYGMTNEQEFFSEVFSQIMSGDIAGVSKDVDDILMRSYHKPLFVNKIQADKPSIIEVLDEYIEKKIGDRSVEILNNYSLKNHDEEIKMASWIVETFGGDIKLIPESNKQNTSTPDYVWNGRDWEYKIASSESSINKRLRKAFEQIKNNPGGIFLDVTNSNLVNEEIIEIVKQRINRSAKTNLDVVIIRDKKAISVLRKTKK